MKSKNRSIPVDGVKSKREKRIESGKKIWSRQSFEFCTMIIWTWKFQKKWKMCT